MKRTICRGQGGDNVKTIRKIPTTVFRPEMEYEKNYKRPPRAIKGAFC